MTSTRIVCNKVLTVLAAGLLLHPSAPNADEAETESLGFVVHEWGSAGAAGRTVCPRGRSLGYRQIYEQSAEGQRREGETDADYLKRKNAGANSLAYRDGKNLCENPGLATDPHYRTMDDSGVVSYGIDLDGLSSARNRPMTPGICAHEDFMGLDGTSGIDNQYLRLTGCTGNPPAIAAQSQASWLPPPQEARENTMLEGGWGILIEIKSAENLENDEAVEVGIYANADPIVLSSNREPIPYATYAADQDPRFRGMTTGKIVDGVLTTEPVDVRFHWLVAGMHLERPLSRAQILARITPDGVLEGYLAGYTPVEALYDFQYGFRNAATDAGEPAPAAMMTAIATGAASVMGRTCQGAYQAMLRLADGDFDPQTGRCNSLSTQYFFRATPAFVVDTPTQSLNESLLTK